MNTSLNSSMTLSIFVLLVKCCTLVVFSSGSLASSISIDGSTGVKPLVEALAKEFVKQHPDNGITIGEGLNPKKRIDALIKNDINIAMASHGIDVEQITRQGLSVHKIAKVAVVIGVNSEVKVSNISSEQLCKIYSGELTTWQILGDSSLNLLPLIRPKNEVDTEVILAHIPCFKHVQVADHIKIKKKSGHMAKALAKTPGSIGMTTQVRVAQSNNRIKALSLNHIAPSKENLLNGDYALTRDLFLITHEFPSKSVTAFLNYIRSAVGTDIIINNNAIPAE
ncbi:substrate-binding domain-containing protein [Thalassotalea euphylliae]|uniref:substrate-binding domain-containing protein n=1 Tax=Thalassotalea euphylliae TaxID=1655234 RepID=UPI0036387BD2